ncbi:MAG: T9SS type A sorting domain-containing protein [Bacteroidetes bacterium]|nr:T9SS type A sorting domain-containing protein [Bacteroidota bacterium]
MKKIILLAAIICSITSAFLILSSRSANKQNCKRGPAEDYLLSLQYPYFGEGLQAYKNAVARELRKVRKTRLGGAWQNEGPFNTGGRINCIAIHPSISNTYLIGCADGGIFKTIDDGANWQPIFDQATSLSVSCIVYDSNSPSVIYAGTGDQVLGGYSHVGNGIYKSNDDGLSWVNIGLNSVGTISKIIIDPTNSNIIYAATTGNPFISDTNRGLYKSTNGGASWTNVLFLGQNAGVADLVINATNPSILYATGRRRFRSDLQSDLNGIEARIYKTSNGGISWDTLSNGLPTDPQSRIGLCISTNNPNVLYANYVDSTQEFGGLYKTTNGGNNWTLVNNSSSISTGGFGWYFGEIRMDPLNENVLYLLNVSLYKSTNGGGSFTADNGSIHADKHDLVFVNSNTLLLGTDGGFYKSTNSAGSWTRKNNMPITQFYEVAHNPFDTLNYYAGAQDNGTNYGSANLGVLNWTRYYGGDGFRPQFNKFDDQIFYAEWQNGNVVATDDGGFNFNNITQSITSMDRCSWNSPYMISRFNQDVLYFGSYRVLKNTNGPVDSWTAISGDLTNGTDNPFHVITTIDESPLNSQVLYAGTSDARVWITQNNGLNWTLINTGLSNRNISCVLASPDSASHVFVSQTGYRNNDSIPHIYYSTNFGSTWTSIAGNLPNFAISDIWIKPGTGDSNIVVANDGGVYATLNKGITWDRVGNNMPIIPVFDLDYNPSTKRIIAGTYARSLMTMPIDSIFPIKTQSNVGVQNIDINKQVQLYPNPANTNFTLSISHGNLISASVYSMSGTMMKKCQFNANPSIINCSEMSNGYYVVAIKTSRGMVYKQLIIAH